MSLIAGALIERGLIARVLIESILFKKREIWPSIPEYVSA